MSIEENKALIRRLNEEFWNKGNAHVLDEVFAADFIDHTPQPGVAPDRKGLKQFNIGARAAFPDIRSTIENMIAEGDKVVWHWSFSGTHKGEFAGIPPTGKQITATGITIDHIANGKIVERWSQIDALGLMQQLGVIPPSA